MFNEENLPTSIYFSASDVTLPIPEPVIDEGPEAVEEFVVQMAEAYDIDVSNQDMEVTDGVARFADKVGTKG